jgi:GNAT superfamily N-acetyltransferase
LIRAMTYDDVPDVDRVTGEAFYEIDVRTWYADLPPPEHRSEARSTLWQRRMRHLIDHDGAGCWVAEDESGAVVGAVAALLREGVWGLSTYAVLPGLQAKGIGKQLLDAALTHGHPDSPGIICASHDPRAVRRYRLAGFTLHPTMVCHGTVRRGALPAVQGVRDGRANDFELLDAIDRTTRGAGHGVDHAVMAEQFPLIVINEAGHRGYAYLYPTGTPYLLSATDDETATRLLWTALATSDGTEPTGFHYLTSRHEWAVDIGLRAGLEVHNRGYLALRGIEPSSSYLPSGHFL